MPHQSDVTLEQQASFYSAASQIHADLPASYAHWSRSYIDGNLEKLCGAGDAVGFYTRQILEGWEERGRPARTTVASIGCGEASIEIAVCKLLIGAGVTGVSFYCVDIASGAAHRAREAATREGVAGHFEISVGEFGPLLQARAYDVVMANQVLHHAIDLEGLFDLIRAQIGQHGIFLTNDMIGRNGHMLWPEALAIFDRFWATLPPEYKYNRLFGRQEDQYSNWDNSKEANEGIRAQDILPELLRRFHFRTFFAMGNLSVALFGRMFGANFDPGRQRDLELIELVGRLDHDLIDAGYLKPVLMFAALDASGRRPTAVYRHWTPQFCVRRAGEHAAFERRAAYSLGEEITPKERSAAAEFLEKGWSSPEPGGVWSNAPSSSVVLPLATPARDGLKLVLAGSAYLSPRRPSQRMEVIVNGQPVGTMTFTAPGQHKEQVFKVPAKAARGRASVAVELRYGDCRSPAELGESADARQLGFFLNRLRLSAG